MSAFKDCRLKTTRPLGAHTAHLDPCSRRYPDRLGRDFRLPRRSRLARCSTLPSPALKNRRTCPSRRPEFRLGIGAGYPSWRNSWHALVLTTCSPSTGAINQSVASRSLFVESGRPEKSSSLPSGDHTGSVQEAKSDRIRLGVPPPDGMTNTLYPSLALGASPGGPTQ